MDYPTIICYTGGTCGDLITSLIDSRELTAERTRLKKPHTFSTIEEKDQYLIDMQQYDSIPSHDLEYHKLRNHKFIGVRVQDFNIALWAAIRFRAIHRPHVWKEMGKVCGATTINDYAQTIIDFGNYISTATNAILMLEDILCGKAIEKLQSIGEIKIAHNAEDVYNTWLNKNNAS